MDIMWSKFRGLKIKMKVSDGKSLWRDCYRQQFLHTVSVCCRFIFKPNYVQQKDVLKVHHVWIEIYLPYFGGPNSYSRKILTLLFLYPSFSHSVVSSQHHKKVPRRGSRRWTLLYFTGVLLAKSSRVKTYRDEKRDAEKTEGVELMMSKHKRT